MTVIAGVDVGTTTVRVSIFDLDGAVGATAWERLERSHPRPGRVEQDPLAVVEAVEGLVRSALADAGRSPHDLAAVGVTNQRGSALAWDRTDGRPLSPIIGWQDQRTIERVDELKALGLPLNTQASCTKFEWLATQHPEAAAAAAEGRLCLGTVDSWITWNLTGGSAHVTDPTNAGATGLYDPGTGSWLDMGMELFGQDLAWHADVVGSSEVVGSTQTSLWGVEVPVAARIGDQQASSFAAGLGSDGAASLTLGTSAMVEVCVGETPAIEVPPGAYGLPLWRITSEGAATELHCIEASEPTGGAVIDWLVGLGVVAEAADLDDLVSSARDSDCVVVPSLAGLAAPHGVESARGLVAGIDMGTGRAELAAAVVDGIAHRVADLLELLAVSAPVTVDGGLANSRTVLQRIADLSGVPLVVSDDLEASVRGAAMLAGVATGHNLPAPSASGAEPVVPAMSDDERASARAEFARMVELTVAVATGT